MNNPIESSTVPFSVEQMSKFIHDVLCDSQIHDQAYGQDAAGNSLDIQWSSAYQEWQLNYYQDGKTSIQYDHFNESSFQDQDPELLYDIIKNWHMVEVLQSDLETV